ncbi:MAG: hypothetical protein RBS80_27265 [Thermoguttaceae bacterium]|jgi:CRISPR-associated endonuclease/helicase Cas3|nr:hypothetical protein [Thermoguttaceae bacterium]
MNRTATPTTERLILRGLDGSNPLGFLAALGTLRVLDSTIHMKWIPSGGTWVAAVSAINGQSLDEPSFLKELSTTLCDSISEHPACVLEGLRTGTGSERRQLFEERRDQAAFTNRVAADWLCALASDVSSGDAVNQLQTSRRDYFLGNLTAIMKRTTLDHLRRALFNRWDYADPLQNQSLHLDPSEDRRHAHQWNRPSGDPNRNKAGGMLGANRLAIEAIPLFPSIPEGDRLHTTGFTGNRPTDTRWTWPIWNVAVSVQCARSLLSMAVLQAERFTTTQVESLRHSGIVAVFRANRILVGKTPNFTPSRRIA